MQAQDAVASATEQFIAAQFQVRSIPTVYAMFQGQPVADLTNARGESQLKAMLDQLLAKLPVQPGGQAQEDVGPLIAMGEDVLASGDAERAVGVFSQIAEIAPGNAAAQAGIPVEGQPARSDVADSLARRKVSPLNLPRRSSRLPATAADADIAHGLARVARWNGQTIGANIFSVAQHTLLVDAVAASAPAFAAAIAAARM